MTRVNDLTGHRFGKLIVVSRDLLNTKSNKSRWVCRCDCGTTVTVIGNSLMSEKSTNCGCVRSQKLRERNGTHGGSNTKEYNSWTHIKGKCLNPNNRAFHHYGGRGITVCERWLKSFQNFLDDMGKAPSKSHEIDRIDNDGNYEPSNCRWATRQEQCNNKRSNVVVTHNGETKTLAQWSRKLGFNYERVRIRLKNGWPFADAISIPKGQRSHHHPS